MEFIARICQTAGIMPVNPSNYGPRGGNLAIVLQCPNIVADDRLVYFDYNKKSENWVIRDFITGQRLDNNHSKLTVAQIVADATHDEPPIWCSVEQQQAEWETYLTLRTTAVRRLNRPLPLPSPPNPGSGDWQPL
jgi:hypothetical protein